MGWMWRSKLHVLYLWPPDYGHSKAKFGATAAALPCLMLTTASDDHRAYGHEECLARAPVFGLQARSSYLPIQSATAVKRLYDLVSSNVHFSNSLLHFNPLNAQLNPICHLLALLGAHPILHVSRIRVKLVLLVFDLPPYSADVKKSSSLNSPRPLWACMACNGCAFTY
jgi:hypothetical protein